ncbi:cytochrome p450 [Elaphomyces granulatus]
MTLSGLRDLRPREIFFIELSIIGSAILVASFVVKSVIRYRKFSKFPLINGRRPFEFTSTQAKKRFSGNAKELIHSGFVKNSNGFRLFTEAESRIILHPKYTNELKNDDRLSFAKFVEHDLNTHIPGFDPFRESSSGYGVHRDAIRTKLTQNLANITGTLFKETSDALSELLTDSPEWHEVLPKQTMLNVAIRISSLIFLGPEASRNPDWHRVTKQYATNLMLAGRALWFWPRFLQPLVHWFLPGCRSLRAQLREACNIIQPIVDKKRAEETTSTKRSDNLVAWMDEISRGRPFDAALSQIASSFAAIHTTSNSLTQLLVDLCNDPELIDSLRKEVITVITSEGWKRSALQNLKLMDSVMKESQRLNPSVIVSMRRKALEDIRLHDGLEIPKGAFICVSSHQMWDPTIYSEPEKFDGHRFLKRSQIQGHEKDSQFAATSVDHVGFGHGTLACPGRFFAGDVMKVVLCHMLLKYDWEIQEGYKPLVLKAGVRFVVDPATKLLIRRRQEEIPM